MKAMILAAGRGERMRPLTDHTPKPLLEAGGKPLIVWHIERLVAAGMPEIVINCAWLADRLQAALGDGARYGARILWSRENPALETAGGIARALPLLGPEPFLVINGDVWCDWDFCQAPPLAAALTCNDADAWLLLVDNPPHHPQGDFGLDSGGHVTNAADSGRTYTFSGIGVYAPRLFAETPESNSAPLGPLLRRAAVKRKVLGAWHKGAWMDVGTPERLQYLDTLLCR